MREQLRPGWSKSSGLTEATAASPTQAFAEAVKPRAGSPKIVHIPSSISIAFLSGASGTDGGNQSLSYFFWKRVWIVPAFVTGAYAASPYRYILAFVVPPFATREPGALELFLAFPLSLSLLLMFMMRWGGDDVCYTTIFFFV
jgi:hypothetical protein